MVCGYSNHLLRARDDYYVLSGFIASRKYVITSNFYILCVVESAQWRSRPCAPQRNGPPVEQWEARKGASTTGQPNCPQCHRAYKKALPSQVSLYVHWLSCLQVTCRFPLCFSVSSRDFVFTHFLFHTRATRPAAFIGQCLAVASSLSFLGCRTSGCKINAST